MNCHCKWLKWQVCNLLGQVSYSLQAQPKYRCSARVRAQPTYLAMAAEDSPREPRHGQCERPCPVFSIRQLGFTIRGCYAHFFCLKTIKISKSILARLACIFPYGTPRPYEATSTRKWKQNLYRAWSEGTLLGTSLTQDAGRTLNVL